MLCINCHNVFACYPLYIASLFPPHFIQLTMQIKITDIIENYEGMSLEAISLLPQFPIYSNYFPSLFNLSFLRNLYIPMNPLIDNRGGLSRCGARVNPLEYVCGSDVIVFRSVTEKE